MFNVNLYKPNTKSNARNISFSGVQRLLPNKNYTKKNIKLISIDIDGTISDRRTNSVSQEVKKAINSAADRGIKVVLNTGRDYEEALKIAEELDMDIPIICNYGKYIKQSGELIYKNPNDRVDLKGDSLGYFANLYGIKKENIMSIGNDVEDISMFKKSGVAVLIEGNSYTDEIKPFAQYIADNANHSAVALAIEKLVLGIKF